ncbi:MAG: hypothetical protein V1743_00275 [Nanoarchaeota archaeon]
MKSIDTVVEDACGETNGEGAAEREEESIPEHHLTPSYLEERIRKTGWVARQALKIQVALKKDREGFIYDGKSRFKKAYYHTIHTINEKAVLKKTFDFIFTYDAIGSLTGYDQEVYCRLHNNSVTPQKITLMNSVVFGVGMLGLYHGLSELSDFARQISPLLKIPSHGGNIYFNTLKIVEGGWICYRIPYTLITKKGLEPVSPGALLLNLPTYMKRVRTAHDLLKEYYKASPMMFSDEHKR